MSALRKTGTNECLVSKEVIEASDRLRKETMEAIAADPVLSAEMKTIRENAEANIRRASTHDMGSGGK